MQFFNTVADAAFTYSYYIYNICVWWTTHAYPNTNNVVICIRNGNVLGQV